MARLKGSVVSVCNKKVRCYLKDMHNDVYSNESFELEAKSWLDDILAGSGGQMTGTRHPSSYKVFTILTVLDTINTITVASYLNVKKVALGEKLYSKAYVEQWTNCLKCASQAVSHHSLKYPAYIPRKLRKENGFTLDRQGVPIPPQYNQYKEK